MVSAGGRARRGAANLSVLTNFTVSGVKLAVGILTGSLAVIAESLHSLTDLLSSVMLWFAVRIADTPADEGHPYGHGKVENFSALVEGAVVASAGGWIVYESILRFGSPPELGSVGMAVAVMLFSAAVNFFVSRRLLAVARRENSVAIETNAYHLYSDVLASAGVGASLALIPLTGALFGRPWYWIDAAVGLLVGLYIVRLGTGLVVKAFMPLVDAPLPDEDLARIEEIIRSFEGKVLGYHELRSRAAGPDRFVDFHLEVSPHMSMAEAHEIASEIRRRIERELGRVSVLINTEAGRRCDEAPPEILEKARRVLEDTPEVSKVLGVKGRRVGDRYRLEVTAGVPENLPLERSNVLAVLLRRKLNKAVPLHPSSEIILEGLPAGECLECDKAETLDEVISAHRPVLGPCLSFHKLRFFYDADRPVLHVHIVMPWMLFLEEAHEHCTRIEEDLRKRLPPDTEIVTHPEPCAGTCERCVNEELRREREPLRKVRDGS